MDQERLAKQMAFIMELDREKQIVRQTFLADGSRKENDAEHAWHMAVMAALLSEYSNEKIDLAKTMLMILIHDVIEIDAGDTYAYDEAGNATKREREVAAAERLFGLLPEDQAQYFRSLWDEFEDHSSAESRFANTLDKMQPVLLNDASGGISWKEHGVKRSQIMKRNERTPEGSNILWEYEKEIIENNVLAGKIKPE